MKSRLITSERGCVVPDEPQHAPKARRAGMILPGCGWSSTQPRSFSRLALAALFAFSVGLANANAADFHVATNGSDAWSGKLAEPNGNDGPFATLERARDVVRQLKAQGAARDIAVLVRGGTYRVDKTVVFGPEDSAEAAQTITYAAYPGERPVFSAGREIQGFRKVTASLPGLPRVAEGHVLVADVSGRFSALYDDEGLLPRARSAGFIPLAGGSRNELRFPKGRLKSWPNIDDVEVVVRPHHAWIVNVLPLASVDEKAGVARTAIDATYAMNHLHFLREVENCWVENVLEELDEPGEWVLNTKEGKLYLWPRGTSPVIAPTLQELLRVEGAIDVQGPRDVPVRNLRFRGLTFMHGDRYTLTADDKGLQHDWDMLDKGNALVRLRGTENCAIEQCHFRHGGSGAIRVDLHGIGNTIAGNHVEHMGGGGILLCGYGPGTKDVNRQNVVFNNHVHHVGHIYWHSPGIFIWQSGENRVANNLIHHTPYTGIIISGVMTDFFNVPEVASWGEHSGDMSLASCPLGRRWTMSAPTCTRTTIRSSSTRFITPWRSWVTGTRSTSAAQARAMSSGETTFITWSPPCTCRRPSAPTAARWTRSSPGT